MHKPQQQNNELSLLDDGEREQLLFGWSSTAREYTRESLEQELFEQQVHRSPEALALIHEDQQMTYEELDRRANQLAQYLVRLAVGPEVVEG